jgi:hypothetical protein
MDHHLIDLTHLGTQLIVLLEPYCFLFSFIELV